MLSKFIAVCGFDCRNCPAFKVTQSNNSEEKKRLAQKWTKATGQKVNPEDILCDGCRAGGRLVAYCATCNIRTCVLSKGYAACVYCPDCPCDKIVQRKTKDMLKELKKKLGM
jgi:hypothetical protein